MWMLTIIACVGKETACDLVRLIKSGVNLLFPPPDPFIKCEMGVIG